MRLIYLFFLCLLVLSSCSAPGVYMIPGQINTPEKVNGLLFHPKVVVLDAGVIKSQQAFQYRIGSYDLLNIVVWDHPELEMPAQGSINYLDAEQEKKSQLTARNSGYLVDNRGYIFFPYAGSVNVSGLTADQIRRKLVKQLKKYIHGPQVNVQVADFRSQRISVIGEVTRPGAQPLMDKPVSLLDAINYAGGVSINSADTSYIYIIRGSERQPYVYWLSAKSPAKLILAENFYLRNNDIVYVAPAGISSWNRVVSQILPTVQTIWYTTSLTK